MDNELCEACRLIRLCQDKGFSKDKEFGDRLLISNIADKTELAENRRSASSLLKAIKQGCQVVVIDLDMNMHDKHFRTADIAKHINWSKDDFEKGIIEACYVINNGMAVRITNDNIDRDRIIDEIKTIKPL